MFPAPFNNQCIGEKMTLIDLTIIPREVDLGSFTVRRILPFVHRRMVGPFVFLDHMGPAHFNVGQGIDVRPHPHIGLATLTYLFEGNLLHRDSLGFAKEITPGSVNWMVAGRGIAHSEHTTAIDRQSPHHAHGLQSWIALPKEFEENSPSFHHHAQTALPQFMVGDVSLKLIAGRAFGYESPTQVHSPLFYIEAHMPPHSTFVLPPDYSERAIYVVKGKLRIGNDIILPKTMPVLMEGGSVKIEALENTHLMFLGGDPFPEQRFIWWNFVSSSMARIEQAKNDWKEGRFGPVVGDAAESIPLPE